MIRRAQEAKQLAEEESQSAKTGSLENRPALNGWGA